MSLMDVNDEGRLSYLDFTVCLWTYGTTIEEQLTEVLWDIMVAESRAGRSGCLDLANIRATIEEVGNSVRCKRRHHDGISHAAVAVAVVRQCQCQRANA